jgi:hypothetical protein
MRPHDDRAVAGTRNRRADDRLSDAGVVPADGYPAVGIVRVDADVPGALCGDQLRLPVR